MIDYTSPTMTDYDREMMKKYDYYTPNWDTIAKAINDVLETRDVYHEDIEIHTHMTKRKQGIELQKELDILVDQMNVSMSNDIYDDFLDRMSVIKNKIQALQEIN